MNNINENKNKKCAYCGNYEGYYIKGTHHFESIKKGFCKNYGKIVANNDCCDCWKTSYRRYRLRKQVATKVLYDLLMDISAIKQILQESQEEEENF